MEVEDALSVKFRTLIEGLMVTATAEIVKIFTTVLMETRVEITRSWREIDVLKQQLEECEQQKTEAIFRAQRLSEFKREDDEVEVSRIVSQPDTQSGSTVRPQAGGSEKRAEIDSVDNGDVSLGNAKASGPEEAHSSNTDASGCEIKNSSVAENSPHLSQETHGTQTAEMPKIANVSKLETGDRKEEKGETLSSDMTVSQPTSNIVANGPSTSVGTLTISPQSKEMKPVVKKRKFIKKKKHANNIISIARALRDRQHLGTQRRCPCCSTDECYLKSNPSKAHYQVPTVYICRKCEKRFKTHFLFKSHECSMPQSCHRCGQMFTTLQGLSAHSREVSPLSRPRFSCAQCNQTFTTQCAWNLHERIHTNGPSVQNVKENTVDALHTHAVSVHKDIKAKLEVRLQRIPDSQLEAALCTKSASLQDNPTSCASSKRAQNQFAFGSACDPGVELVLNVPETSKAQESVPSVPQTIAGGQYLGPGTLADSNVRKVYAVMSTTSCHIQISEDADSIQSQTVHGSNAVKDEGKHTSESDDSGCSSLKKRKMSECSHDAYNGVFPVEKILRWRNNKGRSEVRVKWMPCSLCGAKFQNTWEPAESFPGCLDDKNDMMKKMKENDDK